MEADSSVLLPHSKRSSQACRVFGKSLSRLSSQQSSNQLGSARSAVSTDRSHAMMFNTRLTSSCSMCWRCWSCLPMEPVPLRGHLRAAVVGRAYRCDPIHRRDDLRVVVWCLLVLIFRLSLTLSILPGLSMCTDYCLTSSLCLFQRSCSPHLPIQLKF